MKPHSFQLMTFILALTVYLSVKRTRWTLPSDETNQQKHFS